MRKGFSFKVEAIAGIVSPQGRGRQARETIYQVITTSPGITRKTLCSRTGLTYKQIRRHTSILVQAGAIQSVKQRRSWRYYDYGNSAKTA